jgi:hypothetical protein
VAAVKVRRFVEPVLRCCATELADGAQSSRTAQMTQRGRSARDRSPQRRARRQRPDRHRAVRRAADGAIGPNDIFLSNAGWGASGCRRVERGVTSAVGATRDGQPQRRLRRVAIDDRSRRGLPRAHRHRSRAVRRRRVDAPECHAGSVHTLVETIGPAHGVADTGVSGLFPRARTPRRRGASSATEAPTASSGSSTSPMPAPTGVSSCRIPRCRPTSSATAADADHPDRWLRGMRRRRAASRISTATPERSTLRAPRSPPSPRECNVER